jgi:glucokinase
MLLAGDIGGTKTYLAVFSAERGSRAPLAHRRFPSTDFPSLEAIVSEFVEAVDLPVTHACFAVAGPVVGGTAFLTNLSWVVDERALRTHLGFETVSLLNDLEAIATAVPHLLPADLYTLRDDTPDPGGAIAVIAPGTGLGEAYLTWDGSRYRPHASEGGHADFAPTTPREIELLQYLQTRWDHVSYERVCAGQSIPDLYDFLKDSGRAAESPALRAQLATAKDRTPSIMAAALDPRAPDPLSLAALELFVSILAAEAGNLALKVLATGGVYIAGGIPPRILPSVKGEGEQFLATFDAKGRLAPLLSRIPVHVIVEPVALLGAAHHGLDIADSARSVSR